MRDFAPLLVRDADDRDLLHGRMPQDDSLYFYGRDVLAAADDDVLEAIANLDVLIRMHHGCVTAVEPAVVHADGFIEIRDRIKDVIISGGENISSVEVEGVLLRHPGVQEVAVVGLPDERYGETPHAFVVARAGATLTDGDLRAFARENLAHFKVPKRFHFIDELPKTATGKIQKYVLRGRNAAIAAQ